MGAGDQIDVEYNIARKSTYLPSTITTPFAQLEGMQPGSEDVWERTRDFCIANYNQSASWYMAFTGARELDASDINVLKRSEMAPKQIEHTDYHPTYDPPTSIPTKKGEVGAVIEHAPAPRELMGHLSTLTALDDQSHTYVYPDSSHDKYWKWQPLQWVAGKNAETGLLKWEAIGGYYFDLSEYTTGHGDKEIEVYCIQLKAGEKLIMDGEWTVHYGGSPITVKGEGSMIMYQGFAVEPHKAASNNTINPYPHVAFQGKCIFFFYSPVWNNTWND